MDKGTATDPTRTRYGVRYIDRNGRARERYFATDEDRARFIDDSDTVVRTVAFADPETPTTNGS